jgi:hypothetical protein
MIFAQAAWPAKAAVSGSKISARKHEIREE